MSFVATPTKTPRDTVARALQLVQKTNSWTKGTDLSQGEDSQGKTRSAFCLRGAIRAAVFGETEGARNFAGRTRRQDRLINKTGKEIVKTVNADIKRYGLEETVSSVITFNDTEEVKHRHVLRALRDTLGNLEAEALKADTLDYSQSGAGCG